MYQLFIMGMFWRWSLCLFLGFIALGALGNEPNGNPTIGIIALLGIGVVIATAIIPSSDDDDYDPGGPTKEKDKKMLTKILNE